MKFNKKNAKTGAVNVGTALVGAAVGNVMITMPAIGKFAPAGALVLGLASQGLTTDEKLKSAGIGLAIMGGFGLINQLKPKAPASMQGMIGKFVPTLAGIEGLDGLSNVEYIYEEDDLSGLEDEQLLLGAGLDGDDFDEDYDLDGLEGDDDDDDDDDYLLEGLGNVSASEMY